LLAIIAATTEEIIIGVKPGVPRTDP